MAISVLRVASLRSSQWLLSNSPINADKFEQERVDIREESDKLLMMRTVSVLLWGLFLLSCGTLQKMTKELEESRRLYKSLSYDSIIRKEPVLLEPEDNQEYRALHIASGSVIGKGCKLFYCVTDSGVKFGERTRFITEKGFPPNHLGPYNEIGPYSYIGPHTVIGPNSKLCHHDSIDNWVKIGENAMIGNNAWFKDNIDVGKRSIIGDYPNIGCFNRFRDSTKLGEKVILGTGNRFDLGCEIESCMWMGRGNKIEILVKNKRGFTDLEKYLKEKGRLIKTGEEKLKW